MRLQVNLLPVQYRPQPPVRLLPILITVVLMLNLIAISIYWVTLSLGVSEANSKLSSLNSELRRVEQRVADAAWKSQLASDVALKEDYVNEITSEHRVWIPLLEAIERAMLPGIKISGMNVAREGQVSMTGETDSLAAVAEFLGSLQVETGLEIVRFHAAEAGGSFQVSMRYWNGVEVEEEQEDEDEQEDEQEQEEEDDDE